jgi:hypothetical protein
MALSPSEIEEERRRGRRTGVVAVAAGLLFPAGLFWSEFISRDRPEKNAPAQLRFFHRHAGELLASSVLQSVALLLLIVVAVHLYRSTRARKPDLSPVVLVTGVFGPVALATAGLAHDTFLAFASANFVGRRFQSIDAAQDITKGTFLLVTIGLSLSGTFGLAFWFVAGSLNAMRVGLLSRFMGVLGIIIGPAFLLRLAPLVMTFWLIAVGALFLGRWPRGLPSAWETGEAVPWPSREQRQDREAEQAEELGGSRDGEVEPVGPAVRKPQSSVETGERSSSERRRKRKRRG